MKKLFYVVLLSCVVSISFVGCGGSMKNVSFLEVSNEKVNKKMEKIDKTKFLSFKIEDNRIMFTPDDYKNNFNLIAESLNYNKIDEFTEGSFGEGYFQYNTHDFDLNENTKLRLAQSDDGVVGYKIIMVEHTIQPEDANNNFLDFGNACFVSALACTDIENQEDLKENISQGLSDAINNKGEEIEGISGEEFEYYFELKDDIITFYTIVYSIRNNLDIEDVTDEYPKIKELQRIATEKYTSLKEPEIKVTTDKESWLNLHYVTIEYRFRAKTPVKDKVEAVLFTVDKINRLFDTDKSISISYDITVSENSRYPDLAALCNIIRPRDDINKKLGWFIDDEDISDSDGKAIWDEIDAVAEKWYSNNK